jgi:nucleoside-diphosphate-sugar epimerase
VAPPDDLADVLELRGDIRDAALLRAALDSEVSVVHLASIVSGGSERDFDLALDVNLTAVARSCTHAATTGAHRAWCSRARSPRSVASSPSAPSTTARGRPR